jgi:hypothetical protein
MTAGSYFRSPSGTNALLDMPARGAAPQILVVDG